LAFFSQKANLTAIDHRSPRCMSVRFGQRPGKVEWPHLGLLLCNETVRGHVGATVGYTRTLASLTASLVANDGSV
jgi:hypothetical protein